MKQEHTKYDLKKEISMSKESKCLIPANKRQFSSKSKMPIAASIISWLLFTWLISHQSFASVYPGETPDKVIMTPDIITNAVVAGGGKFIVLKMQKSSGLAVYDADKTSIIHTIHLPDENFLYTAGGQVVLLYYPGKNLFQTWDLKTFKKLKTGLNPKGTVVHNMTMGHNNGNRAFIRYAQDTNSHSNIGIYLLDTTTLQDISSQKEPYSGLTSYNQTHHLRSNPYMTVVSEWVSNTSGFFNLSSNSWEYHDEDVHGGYIVVGNNNRIYTDMGQIYTNSGFLIWVEYEMKLIPGIDGRLFLAINRTGKMQIYNSNSLTPMGLIGTFPGYPKPYYELPTHSGETSFLFDRRIIFDPKNGHIIFIPFSNDRIVQRSFNLKLFLDQSGCDYLYVLSTPDITITPGKTWQYEIQTLSNTKIRKFSLMFAPPGMKIKKNGTITWKAAKTPNGLEKVIVFIKNQGGVSAYHTFDLYVKKK
jgi:hypothetical protein